MQNGIILNCPIKNVIDHFGNSIPGVNWFLNFFGSFDPIATLFDDHELGGSFHVGGACLNKGSMAGFGGKVKGLGDQCCL